MDNQIKFIEGKKVQHAYTKEFLWMLKEGREQILCRTKDLREVWFYRHELEDIHSSQLNEIRDSRRFL